jgi:hypothetical protein
VTGAGSRTTATRRGTSRRASPRSAPSPTTANPIPLAVVEDNSVELYGSAGLTRHDTAITNHCGTGCLHRRARAARGGGDYVTGLQAVPTPWGLLHGNGGLSGAADTTKKLWFDWAAQYAAPPPPPPPPGGSWKGKYISILETATNSAGTASSRTAALGPITAFVNAAPAYTAVPTVIGGTPQVGSTLVAQPGQATNVTGPPSAGALLSVSPKPRNGRNRAQEVAFLNTEIAPQKFAAARIFNQLTWTGPNTEEQQLLDAGVKLIMSFGVGTWTFADVKNGVHDAAITALGHAIAAVGTDKMIIAFQHEPEHHKTQGTAAEYRAAYKHVMDLWTAAGATNETILILEAFTYNPASAVLDANGNPVANYPPSQYDPGTVSGGTTPTYFGADGYNWYTRDKRWTTFGTVFNPARSWMAANRPSVPLIITEVGCEEDTGQGTTPADPTRKAKWITDMGNTLKLGTWSQIDGVSWFNSDDPTHGYHWEFDTSAQSTAAFSQVANDTTYWGSGAGTASGGLNQQWETSAAGAHGSWSDETGETDLSLQLVPADATTWKRMRSIAINAGYTTNEYTRRQGPIQGTSPTINFTTAPAVTGTAQVGHTLTTTEGVTNIATVKTVAWSRSVDNGATWTVTPGATADTYQLVMADQDALIKSTILAAAGGQTASADSNTVGPIGPPEPTSVTLTAVVE